jgi:hypothetical protein
MLTPAGSRFVAIVVVCSGLGACSSSGTPALAPTPDAMTDGPTDPLLFTLTTPEITVPASQERYVCFSKTFDEDVAIDRFEFTQTPAVHHVFLSRSLVREPEGLSECNVIFKQTWVPLFVTGNGSTSLEYPSGAANVLHKRQQIVLQLHLLNPATVDVQRTASVVMRKSTLTKPDPVGIYAFGTQKIALPPHAATTLVSDCTPNQDVEAFATFAHLHRLGTGLHFSVEADDGTMQEVVNRDPYNFDNQLRLLPLRRWPRQLPAP